MTSLPSPPPSNLEPQSPRLVPISTSSFPSPQAWSSYLSKSSRLLSLVSTVWPPRVCCQSCPKAQVKLQPPGAPSSVMFCPLLVFMVPLGWSSWPLASPTAFPTLSALCSGHVSASPDSKFCFGFYLTLAPLGMETLTYLQRPSPL